MLSKQWSGASSFAPYGSPQLYEKDDGTGVAVRSQWSRVSSGFPVSARQSLSYQPSLCSQNSTGGFSPNMRGAMAEPLAAPQTSNNPFTSLDDTQGTVNHTIIKKNGSSDNHHQQKAIYSHYNGSESTCRAFETPSDSGSIHVVCWGNAPQQQQQQQSVETRKSSSQEPPAMPESVTWKPSARGAYPTFLSSVHSPTKPPGSQGPQGGATVSVPHPPVYRPAVPMAGGAGVMPIRSSSAAVGTDNLSECGSSVFTAETADVAAVPFSSVLEAPSMPTQYI